MGRKPKPLTEKEAMLHRLYLGAKDQYDGAMMRLQSLEAKLNAQTRLIESQKRELFLNKVRAAAAERMQLKMHRQLISKLALQGEMLERARQEQKTQEQAGLEEEHAESKFKGYDAK